MISKSRRTVGFAHDEREPALLRVTRRRPLSRTLSPVESMNVDAAQVEHDGGLAAGDRVVEPRG